MKVLSKGSDGHGKWWQVIHTTTNKAGLVPSNYLKPYVAASSSGTPSLAPAEREAIAQFDYKAQAPQQLSFSKGEKLIITSQGMNWWQARNQQGENGAIPKAFVTLIPKA